MVALFGPWAACYKSQNSRWQLSQKSVQIDRLIGSQWRSVYKSSRNCRQLHATGHAHVGSSSLRRVELLDLSHQLVPYEEAWRLQKELVESVCRAARAAEGPAGAVVLLQHEPVYTLGAGSSEAHLRFDPDNSPLPLYRTERGGEVTYHGPGQLVMYPILDLHLWQRDLHWYLRNLEEVVIRALAEVSGLEGERVAGLTGVWVGGSKVAAIGVRASRWVTYHGLALNVTADLAPFQQIVPCGIADRGVTNVQQLLMEAGTAAGGKGSDQDSSSSCWGGLTEGQLLEEYRHGLLAAFEEVFGAALYAGGGLAAGLERAAART